MVVVVICFNKASVTGYWYVPKDVDFVTIRMWSPEEK